jgi:hypothetical protein
MDRDYSVPCSWKAANCGHYERDPFNFRLQNAIYSFFSSFRKIIMAKNLKQGIFYLITPPMATSFATEQSNDDTPDRHSETGTSNYGTPERHSETRTSNYGTPERHS